MLQTADGVYSESPNYQREVVEQNVRDLIGEYEPLLEVARRRKLQWIGHTRISHQSAPNSSLHSSTVLSVHHYGLDPTQYRLPSLVSAEHPSC